ncbi:MAG: hypothetical protein K6B46_02715 [Opitutales bacterium]|nr:hypothetical protein [Opitutales bacterium]
MKYLDKIIFLAGAVILGICVAYSLSSGAPKAKFKAQKERGLDFAVWDDSKKPNKQIDLWEPAKLDPESGWNYDLFTSPETTWLTGEKQYIAKELPKKVVQEILGLELKSIESPLSRVKVQSCNSEFPPKTRIVDKKKVFEILLKLQDADGMTGTVNFVAIPGVKMQKEEIGEGDGKRVVYTLSVKNPVPVTGLNAKFKSLKIAKGDDGSGDGALVTRYMVELFDDTTGGAPLTAVENFYRRNNIVEVVLQDEHSPKQWKIVSVEAPGAELPDYTLYERESPSASWSFVGKELKFSTETGSHEVKMLDTAAEQVTIVTQPKASNGEKPKKSRVVILDISK